MAAKTMHFRVGNGDMMLMVLDSGKRILVDIDIRADADDEDTDTPDVGGQLRKELEDLGRDSKGRLYVDAFLLTHPDQDHIRGLKNHFHLGPPGDWSKSADKILIREQWSSPIVFRRASKDHTLCDDACDWSAEARRRVKKFREEGTQVDGNRILIMGEDVDGKTDDIGAIVVKVDSLFSTIAGAGDESFEARLLAPLKADDEEEEALISKNDSSVILRVDLKVSQVVKARYLIGGDAGVAIWERLWDRNKNRASRLEYDVLIAPHHCSWRSLSYDSWSEKGEKAKVNEAARSALAQAREGALIISSSKPVEDDEDDPPCIRAKREYLEILEQPNGEFKCVADGSGDKPLVIEIASSGTKIKRAAFATALGLGTGIGSQPLAHGSSADDED
ncbi:metallohydrolase [Bradyrhizobium sp. Bra78]|uniref:metallohydrolase n=1 Tax=Bradyrhizobium sp. Bra78 TaxID=2926010 RepID=UPI0021CA396E|nr:metallohydrolase [Bradyrhizobium sp. Bra78]